MGRLEKHFGASLPDVLHEEFERGSVELTPLPASGDHLRGTARTSEPFSRVYMRMIRELGQPKGSVRIDDPVPTPTRAWLQAQRRIQSPSPSFSHKAIAEAVEAMGGANELRSMSPNTARKQFIMTYKELVQGW